MNASSRWSKDAFAGASTRPGWSASRILVIEQTATKQIMVRFSENAFNNYKLRAVYDLADPMTCFPGVPVHLYDNGKEEYIPENEWKMTAVAHPTFHEWIVSTFGALPDFVQPDHYTPRDFIDYMRYMALHGPVYYGPVQW